jgi:holin-like protein
MRCHLISGFKNENMIKGVFLILLFLALGEGTSLLIGGFVPGNVLGMVLLFLALSLKIVKPDSVKYVSNVLTRNMVLFFVPAGVGLMASMQLIGNNWLAILLSSVISTLLVIAVVGLIQDKMGKNEHADSL